MKKNTAWSLGTEVVFDTSGEDEALRVEPEDIPIESKEDDGETTDNTSVKDDEKGASGRIIITPGTNESDSESLAKVKLANNNPEDDTSDNISSIADDDSEVRRLRTSHIKEWLTDERVQEIMENVQTVVGQEERDGKANAI